MKYKVGIKVTGMKVIEVEADSIDTATTKAENIFKGMIELDNMKANITYAESKTENVMFRNYKVEV